MYNVASIVQAFVQMSPDNALTQHLHQAGELIIKNSHVCFLPPHSSVLSSLTEHICLKLQQLTHEGQVWRNDLTSLLHKVKGLIQPDALRVHEVGQTDGGRARDTCLAVHQHPTTALLH